MQIPIERAMELLAGKGMEAYAPLAPAEALSAPTAGAQRAITPAPTLVPDAAPGTPTPGMRDNGAGSDAAKPDKKSATNADGHKP